MKKVRIGIDIGKAGGIAVFIDDDQPVLHPMYTINREYDIASLSRVFLPYTDTDQYDVHVVMEDVHAIYGSSAKGTFEFGRGLGVIEGILSAYSIRYTKVQPKKWQKLVFEGIKEMKKAPSARQLAVGQTSGKIDTKAMALMAVRRLFPAIRLTLGGPRATKPHDGLVDSICLGYYCKITF